MPACEPERTFQIHVHRRMELTPRRPRIRILRNDSDDGHHGKTAGNGSFPWMSAEIVRSNTVSI